MYLTYLRRELFNRKRQTIIVAAGMALAIALVIIVSSVSGGVKDAQKKVLQSVYGVGTDITVSKSVTPTRGAGGPNFSFGSRDGSSSSSSKSSSTNLAQNHLSVGMGTGTFSSSEVATVQQTSGVSAATGVLTLRDVDFSGMIKQQQSSSSSSQGSGSFGGGQGGYGQSGSGSGSGGHGFGGFGGGSFNINSSTVSGIPTSGNTVGPLTSTKLTSGRGFTAADNTKDVAILDASYASSNSDKVGSKVTLGNTSFTVVGIVSPTTSASATSSDIYIPLTVAQKVSGQTGKVTTIYVSAKSSTGVDALQKSLQGKLSGATVSTEAQLANSVSGSLSSASSLVSNLGKWLSIAVLAAAFLIATLFTISGVTRRTREFGTLKAIGWSNGRITRQVAGESLIQGLVGGVIGIALGLLGVFIVNMVGPSVSGSVSPQSASPNGGPGGGFGQRFGGAAHAAEHATKVVLSAPVTAQIVVLAVALAVLGGVIAGAFGGWRSTRLRPSEALRSVA